MVFVYMFVCVCVYVWKLLRIVIYTLPWSKTPVLVSSSTAFDCIGLTCPSLAIGKYSTIITRQET